MTETYSQTYFSDPFAYDFGRALESASSASPTPFGNRSFDVLAKGERGGSLPSNVGLFDGSRCRRCDARFDINEAAKFEHRECHEWRDDNAAISDPVADELAFCANAIRPLPSYRPDAGNHVGELVEPPTREQLQRHRSKFEPTGQGFAKARKFHRQACDETTELFGLTSGSLGATILELRREGFDVPGIAERTGATEKQVKALLAS